MSYHGVMLKGYSVVVGNGPLTWSTALAALCRRAPRVLAADGGANALAQIGLAPEAVIGDMDSIAANTRRWLGRDRLIEIAEQNSTDLDKALAFILEQHPRQPIAVLGALGGRLDHIVGNLATLGRYRLGARLVFVSHTELVLATAEATELPATPGETWAVWTADPGVRVTATGLAWPLRDQPCSECPSTSNRAVGEGVEIRPEGGVAFVMRGVGETFWSAALG